jgi:hypothetical protein
VETTDTAGATNADATVAASDTSHAGVKNTKARISPTERRRNRPDQAVLRR